MLLSIENSLTTVPGIQRTYAATAGTAGATSYGVKNIAGFTNQWAVQFGQTGEETAEIMLVSGVPSGTTLSFGTSPSHTGGTFLYSHAQDTPLYQIHYDQIIINRATAGTAGPFSALATISVQPDNPYTSYNDTSGAATYAYYVQYVNSVSGDLSGSSSIFIPGGPTYYSLQSLRQRTKDKLYSAGYIRTDSIIDSWINEWIELMTNDAIKVNQGYLLGTNMYSFGTAGLGTITDSYFKQAVKVEVTYDNGVTFTPSTEIPVHRFTESDYFNINAPRHAWIGENVFEILPHQQAGSAKMTYAQRFTPLVNDTDEPPQTLKAYTTSCIEYCLSVAYGLDQKDSQSQQHYQLYQKGNQDFISQITPRDQTSIKMIDIVDSTSGFEDDIGSDMGDYVY